MGKEVVEDTLRTIFLAIQDMIKYEYNLLLQFGFANISMVNRNLKVTFAEFLTREVKEKEFETTMRRSNSPVSTTWTTNTQSEFFKSSLGSLIKKPNHEVTEALMQKTQALKLMSMDMSSATRPSRQ
jgi:hypothetical protein